MLAKIINYSKRDWERRMYEALWAYRIVYKTPTGCSPFSLVYGSKVMVPIELEVPSLRVTIQQGLVSSEQANMQRRLQKLAYLEGKRLHVQQNIQLYQARMARAFDKVVKEREFKKGNLIIVKRREVMVANPKGKLKESWVGPYVVNRVFEVGAYILVDHKGAV